MITYLDMVEGVTPGQLEGFFVDWGWPDPPSPETHLNILRNSDHVILAYDDRGETIAGYLTALSDGILSAYIPLLEIRWTYQGQGIGTELMRQMLDRLSTLYMVDLICDPELQPFYERLGMHPAIGMMLRNYERQSGE